MGIFALKAHGLVHFGLFMEIMKDTKPLTLSHSRDIISLVMAAAGKLLLALRELLMCNHCFM